MIINTNLNSMYARNVFRTQNEKMQQVMEKLSSGKRINKAADDAAGLSITERLTKQIRGNQQGIKNMEHALSMAKTADHAIGNIGDHLQRMRELLIQAKNGTMSDADRSTIQVEIDQLQSSINQISQNATFNGIKILDTSKVFFDITQQFAVGGGTTAARTFTIPAHDENDAGIFTVELDKSMIKETISASTSNSGGNGANAYSTYNLPAGLTIKSARVRAVSVGGDSDISSYGVQLYAGNATSKTSLGRSYGGSTGWTDITSQVQGGSSIDFRTRNGSYVSNSNVSWQVEIEYNIPDVDLEVVSPSGETFGIGSQYLTNGENFDSTSNSAVQVNYTGAGGGFESLKFYNPEAGNWTVRMTNNHGAAINPIELKTSYEESVNVNIHSGEGVQDIFDFKLSRISTDTLGLANLRAGEETSVSRIDAAIEIISGERSKYGIYQNALQTRQNNMEEFNTNITQSRSRVEDAEMAQEMSEMTKLKILSQSSLSMLTQSNANTQSVLSLLQ